MENIEEDDINLLKNSVENQFGAQVNYAKDCYALSLSILQKTGLKVSETTLKRFWNLVNSQFKPSKYTLNSLSAYTGYHDWEAFVADKNNIFKFAEMRRQWDTLKQKARSVSLNNYYSIINRMGIPHTNAVHRLFADEKIDNFLKSDKTATAFIAPGGYGKSTIIAKVVNDFFLSENARYPYDIVWFIDCGVIENILSKNFNIEDFVLHFLGYSEGSDFGAYFDSFPEDMRGRIVLVFDGLNEISRNTVKIEYLINNLLKVIASNRQQKRLKLIFTLRPDLWNYICRLVSDSSEIKNSWFDVKFSSDSSLVCNIPPLKIDEVETVLRNNGAYNFNHMVNLLQDGIQSITRIPYFLHLYINQVQDNENQVSDIDLLREFVKRKITDADNGDRKIKLIDFLLFCTNYGVDTDAVEKSRIHSLLEEYQNEFNELVSFGILYEYKSDDKFLAGTTYIKFTHQILFEFLLANYWLREFGFTVGLFSEISDYYRSNQTLRAQIASWLIKYAFREKRTDIIKKIFDLTDKYFIPSSDNQGDSGYLKIINITGIELRKYNEGRDEVIRSFAMSKAREYYFKMFCDIDSYNTFFCTGIDCYVSNSQTVSDKVFGYFIKLQQSFFNYDKKAVSDYFSQIESLDISCLTPSEYLQVLSAQVLYYFCLENGVPVSVIDFINEYAINYYTNSDVLSRDFTYPDILLIDSLFLAEKYESVKKLADLLYAKYQSLPVSYNNGFYRQFLYIYAYSLLKSGYNSRAEEIYAKANCSDNFPVPVSAVNYWNMRNCEIFPAFMQGDFEFCYDMYRKGIAFSKSLKFVFFEKKFHFMLKKLKFGK